MNQNNFKIATATPQEDSIVAKHFYQMWLDIGYDKNFLAADWEQITLNYIHHARQNLQYQAFIAEIDGKIIGSAGCQLFDGLYPQIIKAESRLYGYIWGVYVEKAYRDRGIGKKLTLRTIDYLKSLNCTRAVLHASPQGKPVYSSVGFIPSNQMHFEIF